jgi:ergothioneine biosynthesis protein EgtB
MPDASPAKWHLGHVSWFFEVVVLMAHNKGTAAYDERYLRLFNSYYETLGPRHPRAQRGLLTRPGLADILAYRRHVDQTMLHFMTSCDEATWQTALPLIELGLHHEQQHQELLLTDFLHALSCNPLLPQWFPGAPQGRAKQADGQPGWHRLEGGIAAIGARDTGFHFDNETPRHRVLLQPFEIAKTLVTCGDFLAFIEDGGYRRPGLWLSDGWAIVQTQGWQHPTYWLAPGDARAPSDHWQTFGLHGLRSLDPGAPVSQLSFYEAAAYAEWAGARLPTEFEWEAACVANACTDMHGEVWQWTRSAYHPYPGFKPLSGAVGEYNGKFMVGQLVLRGSSLATPPGHSRDTYRNFFPPAARWQFSGLRLARDLPVVNEGAPT